MHSCWSFQWKCGKLRKTAIRGYLALIWPFRTSLFSALSWNKISHMKLQSLKMFKTTKGMFYKQSDFFANWQGRLWGFVNLVLFILHIPWRLHMKLGFNRPVARGLWGKEVRKCWIWVTLDKGLLMTMTLGSHKLSCTHLFDYLYRLSPH